jgi:hypothetical protein
MSGIVIQLSADFRQGQVFFLFATASTQSPMKGLPGALSQGEKRPEREANYSPPSSAEIKNVWRCTSTFS